MCLVPVLPIVCVWLFIPRFSFLIPHVTPGLYACLWIGKISLLIWHFAFGFYFVQSACVFYIWIQNKVQCRQKLILELD